MNSRSNALDVEPLLRNICRSEVDRKDTQRAKSKILHYLLRDRELDLPTFGADRSTKEELEFLNERCSVFK